MKNTIRAHRNGGQNRIKPQSQNQPVPATPPAGPAPAAAEFSLTEDEIAEVLEASARTGKAPGRIIAAGVRFELARLRGQVPSLSTLGDDLVEVRGLLQTLLVAFEALAREEGEPVYASESGQIYFFGRAVQRIQDRLQADWKQLHAAFHPAAAALAEGKAVAA